MSLAGLDVGTTVCRLIVFDETGKILTGSYREYPLMTSKKWLEIDPNQLWDSVCEVCREAASKVKDDPIEVIGVSAMGDSLIMANADFSPLGNAILAFDTRSQKQCDQLVQQFGLEKLYDITGMPAHPMTTVTKIAWVRDHPEYIAPFPARLMCAEDFVLAKFTGNPVMSWSSAARTMMFDADAKTWWGEMLQFLKVSEKSVSELAPSAAAAGKISKGIAEDLGLSPDLLFVTGGHDQICSAIGSGAVEDGIVSDNNGTFECVIACVGEERKQVVAKSVLGNNKLALYHHGPRDLWAAFAWFNAGSIVRWCRENLFPLEVEEAKKNGMDAYDVIFEKLDHEPARIQVLPHFTGTGTPWLDSQATGTISGLDLSSDRFDILKAVLQGVTYDLMLNFENFEKAGLSIDNIRATGGGSRSPKWMQLKADMTGKEVQVVAMPEASALGAAICAGVAAGKFNSFVEGVNQMVSPGKTYEPDMDRHNTYKDGLERYRAFYNAMAEYREKFGENLVNQ